MSTLVLTKLQREISEYFDENPCAMAIIPPRYGGTTLLVERIVNEVKEFEQKSGDEQLVIIVICSSPLRNSSIMAGRVNSKLLSPTFIDANGSWISCTRTTIYFRMDLELPIHMRQEKPHIHSLYIDHAEKNMELLVWYLGTGIPRIHAIFSMYSGKAWDEMRALCPHWFLENHALVNPLEMVYALAGQQRAWNDR